MKLSPLIFIVNVYFCSCTFNSNDEDFLFETASHPNEFEHAEIGEFPLDWNSPSSDTLKFRAKVGKLFNLNVPKYEKCTKYTAKIANRTVLPSWLIFDKTHANFHGVPLEDDTGNLQIVVKCGTNQQFEPKSFQIEVEGISVPMKCPTEDTVTFLNLIFDKRIRVIKPKLRVMAIEKISEFFAIPHSAFTLKSMDHPTQHSSIILTGPGDVATRSSDSVSTLEIPIGCGGRLLPFAVRIVHQLKYESRDGSISRMLHLPLISWNINVKNIQENSRDKRQAADLGSGDYAGEYYDDYEDEPETEDENYDDELPEENVNAGLKPFGTPPPTRSTVKEETAAATKTTASTPSASTTVSAISVEHPHRHHHGEVKKDDATLPKWSPIDEDNSVDSMTSSTSQKTPETTTSSTTNQAKATSSVTFSSYYSKTPSVTTSTVTPTTSTTSTTTSNVKLELPAIPETDYADYKTEDYEDEDDDDDDGDLGEIESETFVPILKTTVTEVPVIFTSPVTLPPTHSTIRTVDIPIPATTTEGSTSVEAQPTEEIVIATTKTPFVVSEIPTESSTIVLTELTKYSTTIKSTTISTTSSPQTTGGSTTVEPAVQTTTTPSTTSQIPVTILSSGSEMTTEIDEENATPKHHLTSTQPSATTLIVEEETRNYPPYIENRLKRKYVIAGKIFRFVIPEDTFRDSEDSYDLKLEFLDAEERQIMTNSWCQFNPSRREIYGLPLDDHVSKWEYVIRATDKSGASVQDRLTIVVQQHKLQRVFNHAFSLEMRVEKREEFRHHIDWSLKTLRALGRIFNTNMSEITVRKIEHEVQPVLFTWSNDSLPTNYCPKSEIETLFKMLTANDRGDPSRDLNSAVSPELRIKKVSYLGNGVCEELNTPIAPPVNFPPILRNPVNRLNATVGELLVYKVPKDTFYDPEDLDTLSLNLTLLTADRQQVPIGNWLQFDAKNREFYGLPRRAGRSEYQLVCVDSGGLVVTDSLEVVVKPGSSKMAHNVEFSMTIEMSHEKLTTSAVLQRKFVEKLMTIFDDRNASHLHFLPFKHKQQSTIATWYNVSLVEGEEKCPLDQIARLESIIKNDQHGISNRVHSIMEPEFQISTIRVLPLSSCKLHKPKHHLPKPPITELDKNTITIDESATSTTSSNEYLLTFIVPIVVISIMTFCALLAACVLYRRRRTGKMNVAEEGRSSYGNKGIPVIFQEELDEKPEAGTKSPAILKDEKPPLAPPEYSKSGSLKYHDDDSEPYHPPPPFARNSSDNKQRPKPAPTYRKPPPYVPP